jgi:hypothetical protein
MTLCSGANSMVAEAKLFSLNTKKIASQPSATSGSPASATDAGTRDQAKR